MRIHVMFLLSCLTFSMNHPIEVTIFNATKDPLEVALLAGRCTFYHVIVGYHRTAVTGEFTKEYKQKEKKQVDPCSYETLHDSDSQNNIFEVVGLSSLLKKTEVVHRNCGTIICGLEHAIEFQSGNYSIWVDDKAIVLDHVTEKDLFALRNKLTLYNGGAH